MSAFTTERERNLHKIAEAFGIESRPGGGLSVAWRLPVVAQEEPAAPVSFRTTFALRRRRDVRVPA